MIHAENADHRLKFAENPKESGKCRRKYLTNSAPQSILNKRFAGADRDTGDWSNGMIGVSKTFGGSSILSSPVIKELEMLEK